MNDAMKQAITSKDKWLRLVFIFLFAIAFKISAALFAFIVLAQFLFVLFTNSPNQHLLDFSDSLGRYILRLVRYLTYQNDERPFPYADWPESNGPADNDNRPGDGQIQQSPTA